MNSSSFKNKVVLFGSTGFIGRNLLEQLDYNWEISKVDIEHGFNTSDAKIAINCVNTKNNLQAFHNLTHYYAGRVIHLGSGAEYAKSRPIKNIKESDFGRMPKDRYGREKYLISKEIEHKDNAVCLRPFGVFGKWEDYNRRFISKAILENMEGKPIIIYQNVKFSYIWVNDLAKIIDYFVRNKPRHKFYNIGGHQMTLVQIAQRIGKYQILKAGRGKEYTCNDSRVRKETGIKYTPFDKSLKKLRRFYARGQMGR